MRKLLAACLLLLLPAAVAGAGKMGVVDLLTLLEAGVGEAVILLQVEATGSFFRLGTQEILMLREVGASDEMLEALIKTGIERKREAGDLPPRVQGISFMPSPSMDASERAIAAQAEPAASFPRTQPRAVDYVPVQVPVPYPVPYPVSYPTGRYIGRSRLAIGSTYCSADGYVCGATIPSTYGRRSRPVVEHYSGRSRHHSSGSRIRAKAGHPIFGTGFHGHATTNPYGIGRSSYGSVRGGGFGRRR